MRLMEKLRKPSSRSLFFATIFIIPFQTVLLIPFSIESLSVLQDKPLNLFQNNPIILVGYMLLPIVYCIVVSLFFQPKRLVSPLHVQIGTFTLFSLIIINSFLKSSITLTTIENLFMALFLIAIIIITIGLAQFLIVRWVVGLNYNDSDRASFIINGSPKEITKILGKGFLRTRRFILKKEYENADNPITILSCEDTSRNVVIIAFGTPQDNKDKCILATVAFHKNLSWISKSQTATEKRSSILHDIEGRLKRYNPKFTVSPFEKVDDFVSVTAFSYIELLTQSKIETTIGFFKRISKFVRRIIYFTIFALVVLTVACYMNYIDVNTYISVIIPTIIILIIEFGSTLRDGLSIKKIDEFD